MSDGNGHPYSWSAICNGYSPLEMAKCSFPAIPEYLSMQSWPQARLPAVEVTHVWTQDDELSKKISRASRVRNIVHTPEAMIGHVDGILLARDDVENHRQFAEPFIAAGLPIYVDKPFALSHQAALDFFALATRPAQIFSCSALRFAKEMLLTNKDIENIGGITHILAQVPKSWERYAIHVIEPILKNCGPMSNIRNVRIHTLGAYGDGIGMSFDWGDVGGTCEIRALGSEPSPISVEYSGPNGVLKTHFVDPFSAFKIALDVFLHDSVIGRKSHSEETLNTITILELAQ
jgi:hypothetical protein